jgi:NitT/TauT family transport system ATP-binding protein
MLEVQSFAKVFRNQAVISDFSLSLPGNSFTVLVGPSGCGKSTLFDLLMGVASRNKGKLFLDGEEIIDLRTRAAYMAQKDLLLPWLTLLENALLPVTVKEKPTPADLREAEELFLLLGLSGFERHYPGQVSGGMAQRCALARTIFFRTPLTLLDEPLSAVDAITRRSLRDLLLLLQYRFKKTILMITHDVEDALLLADRIILLSSSPLSVKEEIPLDSRKPRNELERTLLELKRHILESLQGEQS